MSYWSKEMIQKMYKILLDDLDIQIFQIEKYTLKYSGISTTFRMKGEWLFFTIERFAGCLKVKAWIWRWHSSSLKKIKEFKISDFFSFFLAIVSSCHYYAIQCTF